MIDSKNFGIRIGTKYYKTDGDKIEVVRIVRRKNVDTLTIVDDDLFSEDPTKAMASYTKSISVQDLISNYRMLLPHGQLCMMIVDLESGVQDVVIVGDKVSTSSDMENGDSITFGNIEIICRQFLLDFFAAITSEYHTVGVSVTKDSCPSNINFDALIGGCKPVKGTSQMISVYAQDNLDMILKLFNTKKADAVMEKNFNESLKMPEKVLGMVDSVSSLLRTNDFIYDYWSMFGILPVKNIKVKFDEENNSFVLTNMEVSRLECILKSRLSDICIIRYDYFVDEDVVDARYSYIKIRDDAGKFYIIRYIPVEGFDPNLYPNDVWEGLLVDHTDKGLNTLSDLQ